MPTPRRLSLAAVLFAALAAPPLLSAQPARAQEAAPSGILKVQCSIPGATVYVDHQQVGPAPLTTFLPEGVHMVRVVANGFDPWVRRIDLRAGTTADISAQLIAGKGTVEFSAHPSGAELVLNGRDSYPTPVRLSDLEPGDYTYKITAPFMEPVEGRFTFRAGENLLFDETLESSQGRFEIQTTPAGAHVALDGVDRGVSPLSLEGIEPGEHAVRLDLEDHATQFRVVDTTDGSKGVVEVTMKEEGGRLKVKTHRADATVLLDGMSLGTGTSVQIARLARGRYDLRVEAPGAEPAEGRITIGEKRGATWRAHLEPTDSALAEQRPLLTRWTFWTAVGLGGGAAATGGWLAWQAAQPEPLPEGDITVNLPSCSWWTPPNPTPTPRAIQRSRASTAGTPGSRTSTKRTMTSSW